jgi:hypothetical protein
LSHSEKAYSATPIITDVSTYLWISLSISIGYSFESLVMAFFISSGRVKRKKEFPPCF